MCLKELMLTKTTNHVNVLNVFYKINFRFQPEVRDGYHDVLMMSIDLNSIVILNIHGVDYFYIIFGIIKIEAINLFKMVI